MMLLIFELGAFFFGHSIFILGGTLFRRFQFLLTFSCFMAFIVLLAVLPVIDVLDRLEDSGAPIDYVILIVFYLLTAFNYWYAYILFRKRLAHSY